MCEQHSVMTTSIPILMYHAITDQSLSIADWCFLESRAFQQQMRFISANFRVIPLSSVPDVLHAGSSEIPCIAVTFDDGFQNFKDVALPILHDENVQATVFLVTGYLDNDDTLWFCRLNIALASTMNTSLFCHGERYDLSDNASKSITSRKLQRHLKKQPPHSINEEISALCRLLGVPDSDPAPRPFRLLSRSEAATLAADPLVDIGAHTRSHVILSHLDTATQEREIDQSLSDVFSITGEPCKLFAYPNGQVGDYNDITLAILRQSGVAVAVTAREGVNSPQSPVLELRRLGIGSDISMTAFRDLLTPWLADGSRTKGKRR